MRYSNLLVASDLSERSDLALRRAFSLATRDGARLHILHVVDDQLPAPVAREISAFATQMLREKVQAMCPEIGGKQVKIDVRFGVAWKTIVAAAHDSGVELIVLGSHRSRGLAELFGGTTLERVVKAARVSVLMVQSEASAAYEKVLAGVDFSPASQAAVIAATRLAPDAAITLAYTYLVPFIDRAEPDDPDIRLERKRIERELDPQMTAFKKSLPDNVHDPRVVFLEGRPAAELGTLAERKGVDLIAVGSHGRSWLGDKFLGSTAKELLFDAPSDVLIAKA